MNRSLVIGISMLFLAGCASAPVLTVMSNPPGASIMIDGEQVGKTPATLKVKFEQNKQLVTEKKILVVKLKGYKERKEVLCSESGAKTTITFNLEPEEAASKPTGTAEAQPAAAAAEVKSASSATAEQTAESPVKSAETSTKP